ncbi:MAG: thiamine pyrophosphate-dependent enzyme [Myxococcota bacterium]
MRSRIEIAEERLEAYLAGAEAAFATVPERMPTRLARDAPLRPGGGLRAGRAVELFEDQARSRALDGAARGLRARGAGYYTISSAGHEQNAVLGALLRPTDPCLLHYRSGALMMARARRGREAGLEVGDPLLDVLLGVCAARDDPVAQGRHKVWGSRALWVPPQTSTVGSHLPKATGLAFAIGRAPALGVDLVARAGLEPDSIVCASFGDASTSHAAALSGIHAARWARRRGARVAVLFVCEDNGLGISVRTPRHWIESSFGGLEQLAYLHASGDVDAIWDVADSAIRLCRDQARPVFLHLDTVRLFGHAGSDVEEAYRTRAEIERDLARDPLLANARRLVETGAARPGELRERLASIRTAVAERAERAAGSEGLASRAQVTAPLAPCEESAIRADARNVPTQGASSTRGDRVRTPRRRTLAGCLNAALADELSRRRELIVLGEDVGAKGGVYGVTAGLQRSFGEARVFDTLLDETAILGVAQGAGLAGLLPVAEIQYLAYLHNALDQLRGEACSLGSLSAGQFRNPLLARIAAFAHPGGFGGHFHNDHGIGALREIPGLAIAAPARGDDAARMLRAGLAMASAGGQVVVFLEPTALYHESDLYEPGDDGWLCDYPAPGQPDSLGLPGAVGLYGPADADLLVVSYANGLRLSLRAARTLAAEDSLALRVLDLRWLAPLPLDAVLEQASGFSRVLVVDECRASGGVADALVAGMVEGGFGGSLARLRAADSYVPLGPAAAHVLVTQEQIVAAARGLARR